MIEINGQQLFNTEDIAKMKNRTKENVYKRIIEKGIKPVYKEKQKSRPISYYTQEQVDLISTLVYKGTKQKEFYRVSRKDEEKGIWVIVACGLSRNRARLKVKELKEQGFLAVATEHRQRFKEPKKRGNK